MIPDRLYVSVPGLDVRDAQNYANVAVMLAVARAPKLTWRSAAGIYPLYGRGFFGIGWHQPYLWWQETGTRPRTMRELAGKTIPMWVDDPDGRVRKENPTAKTRKTASGKVQVLIFRRAARIGARKTVKRRRAGKLVEVSVPASYPGAPGRIARRQAAVGTTPGKVAGTIARFNTGVRWRHPGLSPRGFLHQAMHEAMVRSGIGPRPIVATRSEWV